MDFNYKVLHSCYKFSQNKINVLYDLVFQYIVRQDLSGSLIQEAMKISDLQGSKYTMQKIETVTMIVTLERILFHNQLRLYN